MAFHFVSEVDLDSPDSCVNDSQQERHTPETTTGAEAASFNEGMTDGPSVRLSARTDWLSELKSVKQQYSGKGDGARIRCRNRTNGVTRSSTLGLESRCGEKLQ
jgi:hypothetical protein